jgi:hypothetical protein
VLVTVTVGDAHRRLPRQSALELDSEVRYPDRLADELDATLCREVLGPLSALGIIGDVEHPEVGVVDRGKEPADVGVLHEAHAELAPLHQRAEVRAEVEVELVGEDARAALGGEELG